jgi:hypothetical protein
MARMVRIVVPGYLLMSLSEGSGLWPFSGVARTAGRELGEVLQGEKKIYGVLRKQATPGLIMSIWYALRKRPGAICKRGNHGGNRRIR